MINISIIVPVFNSELFLNKCIDSLINQSMNEIEIILIDDGSQDNSLSICKDYALKDKRIKIIEQKNYGVSVARNKGMEIANGEYIAFVDSDDWIDKDFCKISYEKVEKKKYDIIFFNSYEHQGERTGKSCIFYDEVKEFKNQNELLISIILNPDRYKKAESQKIIIGGPISKLYRREFLEKNNIKFNTEIVIHEDDLLNIIAFEKAKEILYINKSLYHIIRNQYSTTRRFNPNAINEISNTINEYKKILKCYNKQNKFYTLLNQRIFGLFIVLNTLYFSNKENCKSLKIKKKELKQFIQNQHMNEVFKTIDIKFVDKKRKVVLIILRLKLYSIFLSLGQINNKLKV